MADNLAWQLRSGCLVLEGGHVVLYAPMMATSTPATVATVQGRAAAINEIIDREGLTPRTVGDLADYFTRKETQR
jgi:hypothetical protein